jgi:hypothetical protein
MKYSLRSLMIVVAILPPMLFLAWSSPDASILAVTLFALLFGTGLFLYAVIVLLSLWHQGQKP